MTGLPQAFCKLCKCHLRAHHHDLLVHAKTQKHIAKENSLKRNERSALDDHGMLHDFSLTQPTFSGVNSKLHNLFRVYQGSKLEVVNTRLQTVK